MTERFSELRSYQKEGVQFFLERDYAILADEMGLGKTVQTAVALNILFYCEKIKNVLIVCPTSLKFNWKKELQIWCPDLSVSIIKGNTDNRKALYLLPFNIWIASYEQIRNDNNFLNNNAKYDLVILDEAQRIKNKYSSTATSCKLINRKKSWALSGTPLENNIEELISIFSFIKYGTINSFQTIKEIKKNVKPFFLRRTKKEVLKDLPPIIEQEIYLELLEDQQIAYDRILNGSQSEISSNSNVSQLFSIITKLKQECNFDKVTGSSIKYLQLIDILEKAIANSKKIILFSQYVNTLKLIQTKLKVDLDINSEIFHGGLNSNRKEQLISRFEDGSSKFELLLISLKAGGVGLNLNSASIVIMFDMWWNPAVEDQAIQRAHRFGKLEPLHVIKFVVTNSIEEKIRNLLLRKKELFNKIIDKKINSEISLLNKEDLLTILK